MKAIFSTFNRKHLLIVLLFLFAFTGISLSQRLSKPKNLNTWRPTLVKSPYQTDLLDSVVRTNFTITLRDGVIIDCLKWVPVREFPAGGWPTVIMVHGYGDNKETLSEFCRLQAEYGYYTMTFSMRGQGLSGGLSNLISRTEAEDLKEIVNFVRNDTASGVGRDKILIMGGSQGGLVPLMAACTGGLNVKTLINSVAPPNFASSWIENGSVKMSLLWTIEYTPDTARYTPQVDRMSDWIYADNKAGWDSLAFWLPRDRDFVTILPNCNLPVLVEATWQDKFFNANGWLQNIDKITTPMSSYIGAVRGHGGEISLTEDQWHMNWFNNWFFEWLWGIPTTILDEAKYQYAKTTYPAIENNWTFIHDSSDVPLRTVSTNLRLYFNKNHMLKTTPNNNGWLPDIEILKNEVNSSYTLRQAVIDEFTGTNFSGKFKVHTINFDSSPLNADAEMTGTPSIKIDYISTCKPFAQFNFQVYEVLPNGQQRFVTRVNYTDRINNYNFLPGRKQASFGGQSHSHIFKAGSKIRIKVTNLDKTTEEVPFFGTNPFVLPSMKRGYNLMLLTNNFYIDLPIITSSASKTISGLLNESTFENGNTEAVKYSLSQNFPNPFNPNTFISYSIAKTEKVELKVYDITGKEVTTLVNEVKGPGSYNVIFNAVNLSSGVYFYRLTSGSFTEVKKMTLVK